MYEYPSAPLTIIRIKHVNTFSGEKIPVIKESAYAFYNGGNKKELTLFIEGTKSFETKEGGEVIRKFNCSF